MTASKAGAQLYPQPDNLPKTAGPVSKKVNFIMIAVAPHLRIMFGTLRTPATSQVSQFRGCVHRYRGPQSVPGPNLCINQCSAPGSSHEEETAFPILDIREQGMNFYLTASPYNHTM